ncbi:peptidylprolyl isomerase [Candidatus Woesearchaeota archaeon]|nr:peptidylprolyl isomerase [Candidatus Woesearchaeota archaeon]
MVKEVKVSHILVGSQEKANELLNKINTGYNFEKIAQEESKCPSRKKGGDLGWFGRGRMVRGFENASFNLKKGELGIVKTQFGYHIIKKVDEK